MSMMKSFMNNIISVCLSLLGLLSSLMLVLAELHHLQKPTEKLSCEINSLFGCSSSLLSWQAHLLYGIPNSLIGVVVFSVLVTVSLLQLINIVLPKWVSYIQLAGLCFALILVAWFVLQSVFVFKIFCPYCVVIWVSVIGLFITTIVRIIKN